jgi:type III secretory pathway component EscU
METYKIPNAIFKIAYRHGAMRKLNYKAILVATFAAFVFSSLYYSPLLLGNLWNELRGINPRDVAKAMFVWKPIVEFIRTLIIAYVFARFIAFVGISDWRTAIRFGLGI